jgi:hypothetical protein
MQRGAHHHRGFFYFGHHSKNHSTQTLQNFRIKIRRYLCHQQGCSLRDRERLAAAGDAEQRLVLVTATKTFNQLIDRRGLISAWRKAA